MGGGCWREKKKREGKDCKNSEVGVGLVYTQIECGGT